MLKKFLKDGLIYTVSNILTKGISIILFPVYVNILMPSDYGILDYLQVVSRFLLIIVSLEIGQAAARFVPDYLNEVKLKKEYCSNALFYIIFVFSCVLILFFIFSKQLAFILLDDIELSPLIKLSAILLLTSAIMSQIIIQLQAELLALRSAILSFLSGILSILLTIIFLVILKKGIYGALLAQVISSSLVSLLGLIFIRSNLVIRVNFEIIKKMLQFSAPLVFSSIGVILSLYIDRIAIKNFLSLNDLGIYSIAIKISSIIILVMVGFQRSITPIIYHNYKKPETPVFIAELFRVFSLLCLICLAGIGLFSANILNFIAPPAYLKAFTVTPILVLSTIISQSYIFAPGLSIKNKTKKIAIINITVAVINTVLNLVLIPVFGIIGAAIATLIGTSIGGVLNFLYSHKEYPIPHHYKSIIFTTLIIIIITVFFNIIENMSITLMLIKIIFFLAISFILFPITKLIQKKDIETIVTNIGKLKKNNLSN